MGSNSSIEWTDHTFNPWWGCVKVSPGCAHCYAEGLSTRFGFDVWGPAKTTTRRTFGAKHWAEPLAWNEAAKKAGRRARVFCASMADVFEDHPVAEAERPKLWALIEQTPHLDWLLLTKRPENIMDMAPWGTNPWPDNVWAGTSVENQEYADKRIPHLLDVPARVRFLSCEPLLGPVNLRSIPIGATKRADVLAGAYIYGGAISGSFHTNAARIQWVIVGGESGRAARPMHPDWVKSLLGPCRYSGTAFFFKQWGEHIALDQAAAAGIQVDMITAMNANSIGGGFLRPGKHAAGRLLDGHEYSEFPR